jgi:hypothetical protein
MTTFKTRVSVGIASAALLATGLASCGGGEQSQPTAAGANLPVGRQLPATPSQGAAEARVHSAATTKRRTSRTATRSAQPVPPSLKGHTRATAKSPRRAPVAHAAQGEPTPPDPNGPSTPEPASEPAPENQPKPPTATSHPAAAPRPKAKPSRTLAATADRFLPAKLTVRARERVTVLNLSSHPVELRLPGRTLRLAGGATKRITMPARPGRYRITNTRRPAMRVTVTVKRGR